MLIFSALPAAAVAWAHLGTDVSEAAKAPTLSEGIIMLGIASQGLLAHFKGRRGKRADTALGKQIEVVVQRIVDEHEVTDVARFTEVTKQYQQLHDHLVGPDGENGMRSDVREIGRRIGELEARERERLEAVVYDRRRSS